MNPTTTTCSSHPRPAPRPTAAFPHPHPLPLPLLFTTLILTALSCATPVGPQGGPPDRTPPALIRSIPADGATRFTSRTITLEFSEYINRATLSKALRIEPDLNLRPEINWKRTTAELQFSDPLPDNTTLILTLGTDLTDMRSNALDSPIQIAFSTGDRIDEGRINVRVADAASGRTQPGRTVFLFRLPDDSPDSVRSSGFFNPLVPPDYTAQTDTAGIARFIALADGSYRPVWVDDVNRSRLWEPSRESAQPFDTPRILLQNALPFDSLGRPDTLRLPQVFVKPPADTTAPNLQAVGVLSERRLRLRFDEPVQFDPSAILELAPFADTALTTTISNTALTATPAPDPNATLTPNPAPALRAYPLYTLPEDSLILIAQSDSPLSAENTLHITRSIGDIRDLAGNPWDPADTSPSFTGSAQPDTLRFAEIARTPPADTPLPETAPFTVAYNALLEPGLAAPSTRPLAQSLLDSTQIVFEAALYSLRDSAAANWLIPTLERNRLVLTPTQAWPSVPAPEFRLYDPLRATRTNISPSILTPQRLGTLELLVTPPPGMTIPQSKADSTTDHSQTLHLQVERDNGQIIWKQVIPIAPSTSDSTTDSTTDSAPISPPEATAYVTAPLEPGTYRVRLYLDGNQDGVWSAGSLPTGGPERPGAARLSPPDSAFQFTSFTLPEPMAILPSVTVAGGMEGTARISLTN